MPIDNLPCDECTGTMRHDERRGEYVCDTCGLTTDYPYTLDEKNLPRTGDIRYLEKHHNTPDTRPRYIKITKGDTTKLKSKESKKVKQLQHTQKWNNLSALKKQNHRRIKQEIIQAVKELARELDVPRNISEGALALWTKTAQRVQNYHPFMGRHKTRNDWKKKVAGALILITSREQGYPVNSKEIRRITGHRIQNINKIIRLINTELGLHQTHHIYTDIARYLDRYLPLLGIDNGINDKIKRRLDKIYPDIIQNPLSAIACVTYTLSRETENPLTQTYISKTLGITDVTLRNNLKKIQRRVET